MILFILRGTFILLVAAVISLYLVGEGDRFGFQADVGLSAAGVASIIAATVAIAGAVVALDVATRKKKLSAMSGVFLGLIAGLVAAYALSFVVDLIAVYTLPDAQDDRVAYANLLQGVKVIIGLITCYVGISLVLQTKDDFRFVIPYVEFAKQIRGQRPTVLDTSVIVDGRILDIVETRLMQGVIIIPKFVLAELQTIADSNDKLRRARGRRGLDILQKLQSNGLVEVHIDEAEVEGIGVDQKLISLAQQMHARVMTNDFNLNKIATLRGVEVINLNDLAKAMRPVVLPGEHMTVRLVKPGEGPTQGVGYLDDGTMVVVEGGRSHLSEEVELTVTSTLQTSAGRMIFGRFDAGKTEPAQQPAPSAAAPSHDEPAATESTQPDAATSSSAPRPPRASSSGSSGRNPRRAR